MSAHRSRSAGRRFLAEGSDPRGTRTACSRPGEARRIAPRVSYAFCEGGSRCLRVASSRC